MTPLSHWKPSLMTLHTGAQVPSDSEAYRHFCEAKETLALPTLDRRRAYLAQIERVRGFEEAEALRRTMGEIHAAAKVAA